MPEGVEQPGLAVNEDPDLRVDFFLKYLARLRGVPEVEFANFVLRKVPEAQGFCLYVEAAAAGDDLPVRCMGFMRIFRSAKVSNSRMPAAPQVALFGKWPSPRV
ncbi:MAG: hypothetical protein LBT65_07920 [Synergistaceae bacterium]|jgi:hypothetical protein|nr:hypothetical protein [Synergistaceae bacterium]